LSTGPMTSRHRIGERPLKISVAQFSRIGSVSPRRYGAGTIHAIATTFGGLGAHASTESHVETRQVRNDYTIVTKARLYQIEQRAITPRVPRGRRMGGETARRLPRSPTWRMIPAD
jgi:hypothetical protein